MTNKWEEELHQSDDSANYREEFLKILSEFRHMCYGHLGRIIVGRNRIELIPRNTRLIHCAPCRTGPKARELEQMEIEKMLSQQVSELAQTEWAALIMFVQKKDGSLRFSSRYRRYRELKCKEPSFFCTNTMGAVHSVFAGLTTCCDSIFSISHFVAAFHLRRR